MPTDPTLARHDRRRPRQLTSGWFVDYGSEVVLRDRWGNVWSRASVSIVQGGFGYAEDGAQKVPRPFKYDAQGNTVIEGDVVLIDFLDGNPKTPVVLGGVRSARATGFLSRGHHDEKAPYNRLRVRLRALDVDGNEVGDARVDIHGDDGEGSIRVSATAKLQLLVSSDLDGGSPIRLTVADGKVTVEGGGTTEPVLLGRTYTADELKALTQVSAGLASMGLPVTDVAAFVASLTAAGTAGTPYLSQKLEAE